MDVTPEVTAFDDESGRVPGTPPAFVREFSPIEPYDPEDHEDYIPATVHDDDADTDSVMTGEEGYVPDSEEVSKDAQAALLLSMQFDRPPRRALDPNRLPSILQNESATARTLAKPAQCLGEDGPDSNDAGPAGFPATTKQRGSENTTRISSNHRRQAKTTDVDTAARKMPFYRPELYTVSKHGALDDSHTDISSLPLMALKVKLEDPTLSLDERNRAGLEMIDNLIDLQNAGPLARQLLAPDELQSLECVPTSKVIQAMGVKVEDMNQPIDVTGIRRQPAVAHDCSTCQAVDALNRDKQYFDMLDKQEKRHQFLRHGFQVAVNQAVQGQVPAILYYTKRDRARMAVYQTPPVPGIDVIIQATLPRTQHSVASPQDLGIGTDHMGLPHASSRPAPSTSTQALTSDPVSSLNDKAPVTNKSQSRTTTTISPFLGDTATTISPLASGPATSVPLSPSKRTVLSNKCASGDESNTPDTQKPSIAATTVPNTLFNGLDLEGDTGTNEEADKGGKKRLRPEEELDLLDEKEIGEKLANKRPCLK